MDQTDGSFNNLSAHLQAICLNRVSAQSTPSTTSQTPATTPSQIQTQKHQSVFPFPPPSLPARNFSNQANDEHYHLYHEPIDLDDEQQQYQQQQQQQPQQTRDVYAPSTTSHDVLDDIYFRYVTLKSAKRPMNLRSRSYHGPKQDIRANQSTNTSPFVRDAPKNLSATSVAELPLSMLSASNAISFRLRDHCVLELIETETNYVNALEMIIRCFAKPLETHLKRDEMQLIFGHIKHFHGLHSSFQAELVKAAYNSLNNKTNSNPSTPTSINNIPSHFISSPLQSSSPNKSPTRLPQLSPSFSTVSNRTKSQIIDNNNNNNSATLSSCFINYKEKFLRYGEYCTSLSKAQVLLDELSNAAKNEAISAQLTRCQQVANEGKFKLRDLLSLPMQRILKYHLLLAQLIKNTSNSHEDYYGLKKAHETMVDLGQYINEVKRDNEAIQIINDVETKITDLDMPSNTHLVDYGRLIADGPIKVKLPDETKAKRYVFIFDKVIIMCKARGEQYFYKEALVMGEYDIDASSPLTASSSSFRYDEKWSHCFKLVRSNDKLTYLIYAKTPEKRDKWMAAIQRAIDNIRPHACRTGRANGHDFLMHTFDKPTSCDLCCKLLHGLFYQGYRCQVCSIQLHKKCIERPGRHCRQSLPRIPTSTLTRYIKPPSPSVISSASDRGSANRLFFPESKGSYANFFPLSDYPWFCGLMDRDKAQTILESKPSETFLVRVSPKQRGNYVISLNYNSQVKHMRINVANDNQLYLSENRYFSSLVELVNWYENNSLVESFHMLNARLGKPISKSNSNVNRMALPMRIESPLVQ